MQEFPVKPSDKPLIRINTSRRNKKLAAHELELVFGDGSTEIVSKYDAKFLNRTFKLSQRLGRPELVKDNPNADKPSTSP